MKVLKFEICVEQMIKKRVRFSKNKNLLKEEKKVFFKLLLNMYGNMFV